MSKQSQHLILKSLNDAISNTADIYLGQLEIKSPYNNKIWLMDKQNINILQIYINIKIEQYKNEFYHTFNFCNP